MSWTYNWGYWWGFFIGCVVTAMMERRRCRRLLAEQAAINKRYREETERFFDARIREAYKYAAGLDEEDKP